MVKFIGFLVFMSIAVIGNAYDVSTHGAITYQAYLRSQLNDDQLLQDLGIAYFSKDLPFGKQYMDVQGARAEVRTASVTYENMIMKRIELPTDVMYAIPGWLVRGAIREDDGGYVVGAIHLIKMGEDDQPYRGDNPYPEINRFCNHFMDPIKAIGQQAYSGHCPLAGNKVAASADWALGVDNAFAVSAVVTPNRLNHFSLVDVKEALYRALVGKSSTGGFLTQDQSLLNETQRHAYWATVFKGLGHLMHLVEDLAQPQHTRDEGHAGNYVTKGSFGNPVYEDYTDARVLGERRFTGLGLDEYNLTKPNYDGYPIPQFSDYKDYWSSGVANSSSGQGKGLADYSNRGFFTVDNHIGNERYAYPSPKAEDYERKDFTIKVDKNGKKIMGTYLVGKVHDANLDTSDEVKMVRESIFLREIDSYGNKELKARYHFDRQVMEGMSDLLLPRSAAYATGILNHFFRGKMQISLPDDGVYGLVDHAAVIDQMKKTQATVESGFVGFNKIKLKLKNSTKNNEKMTKGQLVAVIKFRRNYCYDHKLKGYSEIYDNFYKCIGVVDKVTETAEEIVVSDAINDVEIGADWKQWSFNFKQGLPINARGVRLQVVYRGSLGSESDAVVVATKDISEPTFFSYLNDLDYIGVGDGYYTRSELNASNNVELFDHIDDRSCVERVSGLLKLSDSCFKPFDLNPEILYGSENISLFRVNALPVGRFSTMVFLADSDKKANFKVYVAKAAFTDCEYYPISPDVFKFKLDNGSETFYKILKSRGALFFQYTSCVYEANRVPSGKNNSDEYLKDITNFEPVAGVVNF